jgi:hypothetical protein
MVLRPVAGADGVGSEQRDGAARGRHAATDCERPARVVVPSHRDGPRFGLAAMWCKHMGNRRGLFIFKAGSRPRPDLERTRAGSFIVTFKNLKCKSIREGV